jgi:hypothetical protein
MRQMTRFTTPVVLMLVWFLACPAVSRAEEMTPIREGAILRSGLAAVQRMSVEPLQHRAIAAQRQPTTLKKDRKTTIILISAAAAATCIYVWYALHH